MIKSNTNQNKNPCTNSANLPSKIFENLPIPWNKVIEEIRARSLKISRQPTIEEKIYIYNDICLWDATFHLWIKKSLYKKHKISLPKPIQDGLKPRMELLLEYEKLCKQCDFLKDFLPFESKYHSASWFGMVFFELTAIAVIDILNPKKVYHNNHKEADLAIERRRLAQLSQKANPFIDIPELEALPLLIKSSIYLVKSVSTFEDAYWNTFIKAYRKYVTEFTSAKWKRIIIEKGKIYLQLGRGQGRAFVGSVDHYQNLFRGSFLE